jgi:ketosteroid isomerase-like protein
MSEENVEIGRSVLEAFQRGDVERALALADPQLVSTRVDPDGAVFHGRAGFLRLLTEWVENFTDWSYSSEEFIDAGDHVVVQTHQWGRGRGQLGQAPGARVRGTERVK